MPRRPPCHRLRTAKLTALPTVLSTAFLGMVLALGACTTPDRFPPACPSLALLPDAADLTRFDARGQDITDVIADARITAVPASCVRDDKPATVRATVRVIMAVTRGPAATTRQLALPYFVAVMEDGHVLDEQDYVMSVTFPSNVNAAQPTSEPIELLFPVTRTKSAAAYAIYVGFRLKPEELAMNRQRGAR